MALVFSSTLGDVTAAIATLLVLVYAYYSRVFSYWEKRGVHNPRPKSVFGNLGPVVLQRMGLGEFLCGVYEASAGHPIVGLYAFTKPVVMVRDLEVVRAVLVKDAACFLDRCIEMPSGVDSLLSKSLFFLKGHNWRHMRVRLTPTFSSGKIKGMFSLIDECAKGLLPCIDHEMSKGNSVLVKDTVARYSTDVIASCAFGVDANSLSDPDCEFRSVMKRMFEPKASAKVAGTLILFAPRLAKILRLRRLDGAVVRFVRRTFWDVVEHRSGSGGVGRNDFVDLLMRLKREVEAGTGKQDDNAGSAISPELEDDDYVAQAFIFIVAGFETSSSVISFTLFELALNPSIQEKLRREIRAVLDKHNSQVTYDAIAEMTYLEMVVSEAMRKYPTLSVLERKCLSDYKIEGTDITIEKGTCVYIPVLAIHTDPDIFPEPQKFDPERFNGENKSKRSNFAHIPFGEGPRICIGMRFGQMQVKTALVHILTSYQVMPCPQTPEPPLKMKPSGGISIPIKDIILAFHKIK